MRADPPTPYDNINLLSICQSWRSKDLQLTVKNRLPALD